MSGAFAKTTFGPPAPGTTDTDKGALIADVQTPAVEMVDSQGNTHGMESTLLLLQAQTALTTITTAQTLFTLALLAGALNKTNRLEIRETRHGLALTAKAFVGVVIAMLVLLPEGLAAVKSAMQNRLQNSINLALGSAIASIGLTIPTVALVSVLLKRQIALGVSPTDMTLLALTLYISALTLGTGRTSVLQGAVHLVIFAAFLLVSAVP